MYLNVPILAGHNLPLMSYAGIVANTLPSDLTADLDYDQSVILPNDGGFAIQSQDTKLIPQVNELLLNAAVWAYRHTF